MLKKQLPSDFDMNKPQSIKHYIDNENVDLNQVMYAMLLHKNKTTVATNENLNKTRQLDHLLVKDNVSFIKDISLAELVNVYDFSSDGLNIPAIAESELTFDYFMPKKNAVIIFDDYQYFKGQSFFGVYVNSGLERAEGLMKNVILMNFCKQNKIDVVSVHPTANLDEVMVKYHRCRKNKHYEFFIQENGKIFENNDLTLYDLDELPEVYDYLATFKLFKPTNFEFVDIKDCTHDEDDQYFGLLKIFDNLLEKFDVTEDKVIFDLNLDITRAKLRNLFSHASVPLDIAYNMSAYFSIDARDLMKAIQHWRSQKTQANYDRRNTKEDD